MKKVFVLAAVLAVIGSAAFAGLDMFTSKNYTTIVKPQSIGVTSAGTVAIVSNTPVAMGGFPGNGALVLSVNCGDVALGSIVATVCVTTNIGTVTAWTNSAVLTSTAQLGSTTNTWTFTGLQTNAVTIFRPNSEIGRTEIRFSATSVTNGSVSAILVTE